MSKYIFILTFILTSIAVSQTHFYELENNKFIFKKGVNTIEIINQEIIVNWNSVKNSLDISDYDILKNKENAIPHNYFNTDNSKETIYSYNNIYLKNKVSDKVTSLMDLIKNQFNIDLSFKINHSAFQIEKTIGYSTYFGGSLNDEAVNYAEAEDGSYFVSFNSNSTDFPSKPGAYNENLNGFYDSQLAKFDSNHNLLWTSNFGTSKYDGALYIDYRNGALWVTTEVRGPFYTTPDAIYRQEFGGTADFAIMRFNPENGDVIYSTTYGGNSYDVAADMAIAEDGKPWFVGRTLSNNFPVTNDAEQGIMGDYDTFIMALNPDGTLFYCSIFGNTKADFGEQIATYKDKIAIAGFTTSPSLPKASYEYVNSLDSWSAYISCFNSDGKIEWTKYINGNNRDFGANIGADSSGNFIVYGYTLSSDFPTLNAYQETFGGGVDAFVSKFDSSGVMKWSTYLGGSNIEAINDINFKYGGVGVRAEDGLIAVGGYTLSDNYPITEDAFQNSKVSEKDAILTVLDSNGNLFWSTYIGGSGDEQGWCPFFNSEGNLVYVGRTKSSDFPVTPDAFQIDFKADDEGFITIFEINQQAACEHDYFNYPNFTDPDNLNLAGEASLSDGSAFLTDNRQNISGGIWRSNQVSVRDGFETSFAFRFTEGYNDFKFEGSLPGADGIAFVVQNAGPRVLGFDGGGIGYKRVPNSLAIELDLYRNDNPGAGHTDPNGNHIAIQSNGRAPNTTDHSGDANYGMVEDIPTIQVDGTIYYMKIDYNIIPGKVRVWLSEEDDFEGLEPVLISDDIELEDMLFLDTYHRAFVGLTSSTGSSYENHEILNWEFCSVTPAVDYTFVKSDIEKRNDIYPNPAKDIAYINLENDLLNYEHIELLNSGGVSLGSGLINNQGNKLEIDLSGVTKGVYYLKLKTNGRIYVYKVVKT